MGIFSQRAFARVGLFLSVLVIGALGPVGTYSTASQHSATQAYVLKVSNVSLASELVQSVGGTVSNEMPALGYVGVELSMEQLELISRSALVSRISEADALAAATLAGVWWHFAEPEAPEVEEAFAGVWWHFAKPDAPEVYEEDFDSEFGGIAELQKSGELTVAGVWWHF